MVIELFTVPHSEKSRFSQLVVELCMSISISVCVKSISRKMKRKFIRKKEKEKKMDDLIVILPTSLSGHCLLSVRLVKNYTLYFLINIFYLNLLFLSYYSN